MNKQIGNILKAKRTESGLTVTDVSKKTKIRDSFITAIEEGNLSDLPESYYDLFLKKYADFLKIEIPGNEEKKKQNDMILDLLTEENGVKKKNNQFMTLIRKALLFIYVHRKFFIGLLIVFLLFLFTRHIYIILNEDEKNDKNESMVKIITIEGDPGDKLSVAIRDSFMYDDDKLDFFYLKISALDSCYICYYSDSLTIMETLLVPGRYLDLKAENIIEAKLGKSGAVDIEFNDNKVLEELKNIDNASSIIKATVYGVERIRRSDKISEYLKNTYGLE